MDFDLFTMELLVKMKIQWDDTGAVEPAPLPSTKVKKPMSLEMQRLKDHLSSGARDAAPSAAGVRKRRRKEEQKGAVVVVKKGNEQRAEERRTGKARPMAVATTPIGRRKKRTEPSKNLKHAIASRKQKQKSARKGYDLEVLWNGEWLHAMLVGSVPAGNKYLFECDGSTTVLAPEEIAGRVRS